MFGCAVCPRRDFPIFHRRVITPELKNELLASWVSFWYLRHHEIQNLQQQKFDWVRDFPIMSLA
jgi:hypothetical protein